MIVKQIIEQLLSADQEAEAFFELIDEVGSIKQIHKLQVGEDNDPNKRNIVVFSSDSLYNFVKATGYTE